MQRPQFVTTYAHGFPTIERVRKTLRGIFDRTPPQVIVVEDDSYPYPYYDGYGGGAYPVFVGGRRGGRGGGGHGGGHGGGGHHRGIGNMGDDFSVQDAPVQGPEIEPGVAVGSAQEQTITNYIRSSEADTTTTATVPQTSTGTGPSWLPGAIQGGVTGLFQAFGVGAPSAPKAAPSSGSFLTSTPVLVGGAVLVGILLLRKKKSAPQSA